MSFSKKIIAGVAAVATLAALAPAVAMAEGDQSQNSAASAQSDSTIVNVSFYAADGTLLQSTGWPKGTAFSMYALGVQAPAVEGKIFTGWGFASNDGDVPVDPNAEVTGNWSVYPMYKDTPTSEDKTLNTVSFYNTKNELIQTVSYYAKDKVKFSTYAAGIQAPAVEGKTFTGWGFASNDGNVAVNPDAEVTGNWSVYPMYKDTPTSEDKTLNTVSFYNTKEQADLRPSATTPRTRSSSPPTPQASGTGRRGQDLHRMGLRLQRRRRRSRPGRRSDRQLGRLPDVQER